MKHHDDEELSPEEKRITELLKIALHEVIDVHLIHLLDQDGKPDDLDIKLIVSATVSKEIVRFRIPSKKDMKYHRFMSMALLEAMLAEHHFIRVNQNQMINCMAVREVHWKKDEIEMNDSSAVTFSRYYRSRVKEELRRFII